MTDAADTQMHYETVEYKNRLFKENYCIIISKNSYEVISMDIQKVLIADDEKHIREILKMYCEKEGFDVNENLLLKELIHQELISFIELTIKDLPVKEKERILKKYVQCKTLESIAIEENCSMPAVYYSIKIVLKKIKEVLIKNGYDIND